MRKKQSNTETENEKRERKRKKRKRAEKEISTARTGVKRGSIQAERELGEGEDRRRHWMDEGQEMRGEGREVEGRREEKRG